MFRNECSILPFITLWLCQWIRVERIQNGQKSPTMMTITLSGTLIVLLRHLSLCLTLSERQILSTLSWISTSVRVICPMPVVVTATEEPKVAQMQRSLLLMLLQKVLRVSIMTMPLRRCWKMQKLILVLITRNTDEADWRNILNLDISHTASIVQERGLSNTHTMITVLLWLPKD